MNLTEIVKRGWAAFGVGDFDRLIEDYTEDMRFIMPGQSDLLEGRDAFRAALDGVADLLPPGLEIKGLRHIEGDGEVVSILEWTSAKITSSQLAILFKFAGDKICEERWFIDTEQWKSAF